MRSLRALLALVVATVLLGAAPAAAHSDEGTMTVTAATVEGLRAHLEVGVLYTDQDLAEEATVTATLTGPDGASVGPVPVAHLTGARYAADVDLPAAGAWTATITSTGPKASATATLTATAPATTTTEAATSTTAPELTVPAAREDTSDDDSGAGATPWIVAGVVVVALAGGAALVLARRR